jgi:hypothetical protein
MTDSNFNFVSVIDPDHIKTVFKALLLVTSYRLYAVSTKHTTFSLISNMLL